MNYYRNPGPPSSILGWIMGIVATILIVGIVMTCLELRQFSKSVQRKIDTVTAPVIVQKYDSTIQAKIESIEANRQMSHKHVDNLYGNQLQDVLDSLYNSAE